VVQSASLPSQKHAVGTLETLLHTIACNGLGSPSIIVVGDVLQGLAAASSPAHLAMEKAA